MTQVHTSASSCHIPRHARPCRARPAARRGPLHILGTARSSSAASMGDTAGSESGPQCTPSIAFSRRHLLQQGLGACTLAVAQPLLVPGRANAGLLVEEDISTRVFDASVNSVVSVIINQLNKAQVLEQTGVGSGFVWATDKDTDTAWIVTNYHVISKVDKSSADAVKVSPSQSSVANNSNNGSVCELLNAFVLASDSMMDLAVLRVSGAAQLTPLRVGTSADLQIGQTVFALGAPYGLSSSMSAGVVSGLNRSIPSPVGTRIYGAIQTDASINQGNSGGPLLDSSGRIVGVNTATFTRTGTGRGSGVNFALPIDAVRDVIPKLIVYGNPRGKRV